MMLKMLHVVMVFLMRSLTSALPLQEADVECPAGQFLSSGSQCSVCENGSFTSKPNTESMCHPCFRNCKKELHMEVVRACRVDSDVVCRCMDDYICAGTNPVTGQCRQCELKIISTRAQTSSTAAPQITNSVPIPAAQAGMLNIWIVVIVMLVILVCFITLHLCRQRRKECLKKLVKRCSPCNQKEDIATTSIPSQINKPIKAANAEEVQPYTPTSISSTLDCPNPQPVNTEQPLPSTGNLGPLHIYGAGTVFVSLLNQFGMNGGEKDEDDVHQQSFNQSELHSPTSPLPLSTEERNRDSGFISFPSQEQGKECHMSKEEGL